MRVSITKKEFEAILFGLDQISDALESASDEEYIKSANEAIDCLYNISDKYKIAQLKAKELNECRSYVRAQNAGMPQAKIDRLARGLLKKIKEHTNKISE